MQEIVACDVNGNSITNLVQWDSDVYIYLSDTGIDRAYQVHFFNNVMDEALVVNSTFSNERLKVKIPNKLLIEPYIITGYVNVAKDNESKCLYGFKINIKKKPKPSNIVHIESNDYVSIEKIRDECKEWAKNSESWAIGGTGTRTGEDTNNSKYYSQQSKSSANTASTKASEAAASASAAKTSETNAKTSETNSKASETAAKTSETNAASSKTAAANSATSAANSASTASTKATAASNSANTASTKATEAANSASAAKTSETNAKTSETNAKNSETNAKTSETNAASSKTAAKTSETNAASSASTASTKATEATNSATESKSYATGGTGTRTNENIDNAKYYYEQSKSLVESFSGTLRPMGTVAFANLPVLSAASEGDMYNISNQFTTTADFKEGAGNVIPAGANVYKTADGKWDVLAGTPVTGVKGDAETSYRKGNVNITPENIGAATSNHTHSAATQSAAGLMSADDKKKLDGVASGANAYTHPATSGNKHIPAGGSSGQILRWSADGTAVWGADNNTTYSNMTAATASAAGTSGLVPAPAAGKQTSFLRGDGTWQTPTDNKVIQTNTTTSGDYRVLFSNNANDTNETNGVRKSAKLLFNPSNGTFYSTGYDRQDISGQTIDVNTYNLSVGHPQIQYFINKTNGGAANITNIPVANLPFVLDVELIRWASATDYITKQTFKNYNSEWERICTSGTWSAWTKKLFTDNNTTYSLATSSANGLFSAHDKSWIDGKFRRYIYGFDTNDTTHNGYYKICSVTTTTTYKTYSVTLRISSDNFTNFAVAPIEITIVFRVNAANSLPTIYVYPDRAVTNNLSGLWNYLYAKYNSTAPAAGGTFTLYFNKTAAYQKITVDVLHESQRSSTASTSNYQNVWTFDSSNTFVASVAETGFQVVKLNTLFDDHSVGSNVQPIYINKGSPVVVNGLTSNLVASWLNGNQGTTAAINMTGAGTSYKCLARMLSTNGVFTQGAYQEGYYVNYTSNTTINAGSNGRDKSILLLDESGNSLFPGRITANSLTLTSTTDAAAASDNSPALIIGSKTGGHLELDNNEIMAKSNGTTATTLYLNTDGGNVSIGNANSTVTIPGIVSANKLKLVDGVTNQTVLQLFDDGDTSNNGGNLIISGAGNTYIGSGEAPQGLYNAHIASTLVSGEAFAKTSERCYVASDGEILFETNCQTIANRKVAILNTAGAFYPGTNNGGDLGAPGYKWNNAYIATVHGALDGNASTATQVYSTVATPSTATVYQIAVHTDNTSGNKSLYNLNGFHTSHLRGTTATDGYASLVLGNNIASGADGNKYGQVLLYGKGANYNALRPYDTTSNVAKYMVGASSSAAVGSSTKPVYVNSNGILTAISSYEGNAGSATKLATARSINGTSFDGSADITTTKWGTARTIGVSGDVVGTVSIDGSANKNIPVVRRGCAVGQTGNTTTNPWFKFASLQTPSANYDGHITFHVYHNYSDNSTRMGILKAHIRTQTNNYWQASELVWEVGSSSIPVANFVLVHTANNVAPCIVELWCKSDVAYAGYQFDVISEGARYARNTSWTLYNQPTGTAAVTSGRVNQNSTLMTISNPTTGNAATATKASKDSANQDIVTTYIKSLSVSGKTITYTKGDGGYDTITTQDTTYSNMTAATASTAGKAGLVPAPAAGAQAKYLRGDGTWQTPPDTNTTYSNATTTAAGLMSAADKTKLNNTISIFSIVVGTLASLTASGGSKILVRPTSATKALVEIWKGVLPSSSANASVYGSQYYTGLSSSMTAITAAQIFAGPSASISLNVNTSGNILVSGSVVTNTDCYYRVTWYL